MRFFKNLSLLFCLLCSNSTFAQYTYCAETVELKPEQKALLEGKFSEIQAFRLDKKVIKFYLQKNELSNINIA